MPDVIKSAFKAIDSIPVVGHFLAPALGAGIAIATGNPEFALLNGALGSGIGSGLSAGFQSGNPLTGLEAGIGSGLGSYAGGSLLSGAGGLLGQTPANALGDAFGGSAIGASAPFGSFAGNVLGGQTLGQMAGSAIGSTVGGNVAQSLSPQQPDLGGTGTPGFAPSMQPQMGLPQSLSQFGNLTPNQQATNIASKGVYGGGQGPDETNYFLNLMNRQLFDQGGNVNGNTSNIAPVDMSFLNQLGISGSSPTDLLKGISQYGQPQQA